MATHSTFSGAEARRIYQQQPSQEKVPVSQSTPMVAASHERAENREQEPVTMGSIANAPHTIAGALRAIEECVKGTTTWDLPKEGKKLQKALPGLKVQLDQLADEISYIAQIGGVNDINTFLEEKGFSIRLDPVQTKEDISSACVLKILVLWAEELAAEKTKMTLSGPDKKEVDAVKMPEFTSFFTVEGFKEPIAAVPTQNGYTVCMVKYDGPVPADTTSLYRLVATWSKKKQPVEEGKFKGLKFPMVDFSVIVEKVQELMGAELQTDGNPAGSVKQAKMEYKLQMNEKGARAQAAAAVGMSRGIGGPRSVYIDGPFIVWFEKDGGVIPFAARIAQEHMKNPGSLGDASTSKPAVYYDRVNWPYENREPRVDVSGIVIEPQEKTTNPSDFANVTRLSDSLLIELFGKINKDQRGRLTETEADIVNEVWERISGKSFFGEKDRREMVHQAEDLLHSNYKLDASLTDRLKQIIMLGVGVP